MSAQLGRMLLQDTFGYLAIKLAGEAEKAAELAVGGQEVGLNQVCEAPAFLNVLIQQALQLLSPLAAASDQKWAVEVEQLDGVPGLGFVCVFQFFSGNDFSA